MLRESAGCESCAAVLSPMVWYRRHCPFRPRYRRAPAPPRSTTVPRERRSVYRASSPPPSSESHRSRSPTLTGPSAGRALAMGLVRGCGMEYVDAAIISSPFCTAAAHGAQWPPGRASSWPRERRRCSAPTPVSLSEHALWCYRHIACEGRCTQGSSPGLCAYYKARAMPTSRPRVSAYTRWGRRSTRLQGLPGLTSVAHARRGSYLDTSLTLRGLSHFEPPFSLEYMLRNNGNFLLHDGER